MPPDDPLIHPVCAAGHGVARGRALVRRPAARRAATAVDGDTANPATAPPPRASELRPLALVERVAGGTGAPDVVADWRVAGVERRAGRVTASADHRARLSGVAMLRRLLSQPD